MSQQLQELEIEVNPAYIPLYEDRKRFIVLPGGAGSGKSVFCADKIVHRTLCELDHKFLCLRKVGDTVEESIFAEITEAIENRGASHEFKVNKTKHSFTHLLTGNVILCKGLDDVAKMKSIKGITGMWLEEATEFEDTDFDQLNIRIRGKKKNYVQYLLSFNPIDESHWLKSRFIDNIDTDATVLVTTYEHNLFLTNEDKEQLLKLAGRNQLYYDVYVLAKWGVVVKTNKFFYAFDRQKHVIKDYELNRHLPIYLSFDFNKEPMTALASQNPNSLTAYIFEEFQIPNGSTPELCEVIKAKYPGHEFMVTGDATGQNRSAMVRGNLNHYRIIKSELGLKDYQIKVSSVNMAHKDSRILCASVMQNANFYITENCKKAIEDATFSKVDEQGELVKTAKEGRHLADNIRYTIHCIWPDFIKNPKKYRQ